MFGILIDSKKNEDADHTKQNGKQKHGEDGETKIGGLHTVSSQRRSSTNLTCGCFMAESHHCLTALFSMSHE
ncbi:hypothetical protein T12_15619 [Trichinella patagoniensis]|uniref:Uncharacterized protein n=1 Tax=Trichinella patagoniensis TaxID=990121 RepID=A0A0V0Z8H4_9BILA|nr:hypothetical protein T12_15619 [Trichinella patagoniensis]